MYDEVNCNEMHNEVFLVCQELIWLLMYSCFFLFLNAENTTWYRNIEDEIKILITSLMQQVNIRKNTFLRGSSTLLFVFEFTLIVRFYNFESNNV